MTTPTTPTPVSSYHPLDHTTRVRHRHRGAVSKGQAGRIARYQAQRAAATKQARNRFADLCLTCGCPRSSHTREEALACSPVY